MDKRFLMVGLGLIAAIVVVTLAILVGGPRRSTAEGPKPAPPTITNPGITLEDLNNPRRADAQDLIEVVEDFQLYSEDGDTVTLFTGDQVVPQPNFVADVVRPAAEVRFADDRVLRITADAGRFYHPGNEPTRGEFHQNTVVTQYQAPPGQPLDTTNDQHIEFRLYLDDLTRFDRENGHITSEGPVRLVGPAVDFTGTGLDLTFNLLDQRVEQLIIAQGDQLRLAQGSTFTSTNDTPQSPGVATPGSDGPTPAPNPVPDTDKAPQTYRVVLYDNLDINVGPDNTTLTGDRLEVLFTLAPGSNDAPGSDNTQSRGMAIPRSSPAIAAVPPLTYINNTNNPSPSAADHRALLTPAPDDILVKWSGRLELNPVRPQSPGEASPGSPRSPRTIPAPEQAVLSLHGSPAVLDSPAESQRIAAAVVGYRTDGQTVFADGSDAHPLTLDSPELGRLQAAALTLSQENAAGQILGPGRLAADDQGLDVTFADRLDLAFHRHADDTLADLQSATFHGNVHAVADSDNPEQQLDLTSQSLTLTLTPEAAGQNQPSHLQATGTPDQPVLAKQPNTTFTAQSLDVDLAPQNPGEASPGSAGSADSQNDSDKIQLTRLRALGNITVELLEEQTTLTAHALDADPRGGRLELFGENDQSFATLTREGTTLAGVHLILQENAQTADALGPGTFSADVNPDDPTAKLNIMWSRSMAFDNLAGSAKFVGQVRSASTSATDDTSLDAHTLDLTFVPQNLTAQSPGVATPGSPGSNNPPTISGGALDLRRAHAFADPDNADAQVNFTAQTFAPPAPGNAKPNDLPLTRLTLLGRELIFINQPPDLTNATTIDDNITIEQVIVPTRGRMLLEDYRTPKSRASGTQTTQSPGMAIPGSASTSSGATSGGAISFAGRGVTLFAWEDQLTLDAQANDLRLEQDVYMLHRPAPGSNGEEQEPIKLDAQRLVADLTETGGLGAYLSQDRTAPQAQIRKVNADGRVRIAQGPSNVVADHLEYDEASRTVVLWAEPRREVVLNRDDQPNGKTTARALRWDLDHDLFTALEPGSNLIPIE